MTYHCWCWPWSPELVVWFNHCKVTFYHSLFFRSKWFGSPTLKEGGKRLSCASWRGKYRIGSKYATPNTALWYMSYFELKAFEIHQVQKEAFPELPLYLIKRRNFWEMRTAINSLFWGNFTAKRKIGSWCQHGPAKATLISHWIPARICLTMVCHSWKPKLFSFVLSLLYKCIVLCQDAT